MTFFLEEFKSMINPLIALFNEIISSLLDNRRPLPLNDMQYVPKSSHKIVFDSITVCKLNIKIKN